MARTTAIAAAVGALLSLTPSARAEQPRAAPDELGTFEQDMHQAFAERERLGVTLLVTSVASLAGAIPMLVPAEPDQALRVGGLSTLLFGGANLGFAVAALVSVAADRERFDSPALVAQRRTANGLARAELEAIEEASQDATIYAVNLGLDALYLGGGVAALVGGGLRFDAHANRWLAAGIAISAQALFLVSFDATGVALTSERHAKLVHNLHVTPVLGPNAAGGTDVGLAVSAGF